MAYLASILILLVLSSRTSHAQTDPMRFWAGEIPPYAYVDAAQKSQGDLFQVFQTLVTRMGYANRVEIIPWKRVLMETQKKTSMILFIPAARSPDREKLYHWVAPLMTESFGVFALADRQRDMLDKKRIRATRICTLRGSATEELARRHELTALEVVATNDTCARLLKAGRVDGWLAARRAAYASFVQVGYDPAQLKAGLELEQWPLYLAASKSVPEEDIRRWRAELLKMKTDGVLDRLIPPGR